MPTYKLIKSTRVQAIQWDGENMIDVHNFLVEQGQDVLSLTRLDVDFMAIYFHDNTLYVPKYSYIVINEFSKNVYIYLPEDFEYKYELEE